MGDGNADNAVHICVIGAEPKDWIGEEGNEEIFPKTLSYFLLYKITLIIFSIIKTNIIYVYVNIT